MGQYYYILMKEENKKSAVYNRDLIVNGKKEYTFAKLMEHSWWLNPMVNAIAEKIYNTVNPVQIIWMGDYANGFIDEKDTFNGLSYNKINKLYDRCWSRDSKTKAIKTTEFTLDGKFLINHTKKLYINCSKYYEDSVMKTKDYGDWCIHPLPLLTCLGNGLGGGDYRSPTDDSSDFLVGTWAWDNLSIKDEPILEYDELEPVFKEIGCY